MLILPSQLTSYICHQRRLLNIYYFASKVIFSDKIGSSIKTLWKMVYNPLIFIICTSRVKDNVIFQWLPAAICSEITNIANEDLHLSKNPYIFLQVISLCDLPEYHCVPHKINTKC